jgi:hypothetical protein
MKLSIRKKFFRFASGNNNKMTEGVEMLSPPPIARRRSRRRSKTISEMLRRSTRRQRRPKLDRHFAGAIERYEKCRKLESAVARWFTRGTPYADIMELIRM